MFKFLVSLATHGKLSSAISWLKPEAALDVFRCWWFYNVALITFPRPSFKPPSSQREWAQCRQHHGRRIAFTSEAIRYGEVSPPKSGGTQRTMAAALSPKIRLQHLCMLGLQLHTAKYCILPCLPSIIHFLSSCHSLCTKITSHLGTWWFQVSGWWSKVMKRDGY